MTTNETGAPTVGVAWATSPDGLYVALTGEIDMSSREALGAALAVVEAATGNVLIDVNGVTFFGWDGLSFLARCAELLMYERGRRLTLANPNRQVMQSIELFGIQDRLTIVPTPEP